MSRSERCVVFCVLWLFIGDAHARDRLVDLIPDPALLSPASADANGANTPTRVLSGPTAAVPAIPGISLAPAQFSFVTQVSSPSGDLATYAATDSVFTINQYSRYANRSLYSAAVWEMDLDPVRGTYIDLELNLDLLVQSRTGDGEVAVYISYTDAEAGITYDADNLADEGTGADIWNKLELSGAYRRLTRLDLAADQPRTVILSAFDLDPYIAGMDADDSRFRVVVAGSGYRRTHTYYRDLDSGGSAVGSFLSGRRATLSVFDDFLEDRRARRIPRLPDFSYSGRAGMAAEPPPVTPATHQYVDVTTYGAVPDDGLSDRAAVQAAIAAAEAHSGPAVVFFPPGRFVLRDANDVGRPSILIQRSDLVLKGSGAFSGGTELVLLSESLDAYAFQFRSDNDAYWRGVKNLTDLSRHPARGQRVLEVEDGTRVQAGSIVRLSGVLPDNYPEFRAYFQPTRDESAITNYFNDAAGADWRSDFLSTVEIESVDGNRVTLKEPLQADYSYVSRTFQGGPRLVQIFDDGDDFLADVGIEDLAFVSNYREHYDHFFNRAADGYNFLSFSDVKESWVRRVRMRHGTRCIMFSGNGKGNVVYDVMFEGNSGHYSMTVAGNCTGVQASFLREFTAAHHGYGATSSAFGTVYHRCNQFGGPEGHSGYPQATLYDRNEGDLSVVRYGGSAPHMARHTLFWNWNQDLFVPRNTGINRGDGRMIASSLGARSIDFWPDRILRPSVVGLHGRTLSISDPGLDLEEFETTGAPAPTDSLFEAQLAERLGAVPAWLAERASSFEAVSRYSQVDIQSPLDDTGIPFGSDLQVVPGFHPRFDANDFALLELRASRGHELDTEEQTVAGTVTFSGASVNWRPPAPGPWRVRLILKNVRGEEISSESTTVFVEPAGAESFHAATRGWLQPRSLPARDIWTASQDVVFVDPADYRSQVLAIEKPLVQSAVDNPSNRAVGEALIDGNLSASATGDAALRWFGVKGLVVDLGTTRRVDFVDLVTPSGSADFDLYGRFSVQVSSQSESEYSYTNSDLSWRTARRFGLARTTGRLAVGADRVHRVYLPATTSARYVRLLVALMDSRLGSQGNLSEIRCGWFPQITAAELAVGPEANAGTFSGARDEYLIARQNGLILVRDLVGGRDGDRLLRGIDALTFLDMVISADPLQAWQAAHFPTDFGNPTTEASIWGRDADPDLDGKNNLFEYIAGTPPLTPSGLGDFSVHEILLQPMDAQVAMRLPATRLGIDYEMHLSDDLLSWEPGPQYRVDFTGQSVRRRQGEAVGDPLATAGTEPGVFVVSDALPPGEGSTRFVRLKAIYTP